MKTGKIRVGALLFGLLALGLAIAGQLAFKQNPPSGLRNGLILYALAVIFFLVASSSQRRRLSYASWSLKWNRLRLSLGHHRPLSLVLLLMGVSSICYAAFTSSSLPSDRSQYYLLIAWGLGLIAVLQVFLDWDYMVDRWRVLWHRLLRPSPEVVLVAVLLLATFLLRAINLEHIPYILSGDEGEMGLEALNVLKGQLNNPFSTGVMAHPTLYFYLLALAIRLFGVTTAALRWPSVIFATITVLWLYKLTKRWYGTRVAIIATILYAGYHFAIHYARIGMNNIWDPFFALGVLWYAQRGLDERRFWPWAISGLLFGLCIYFYRGARFISVILAVFLLIRWLQGVRLWHEHLWHIVVLVFIAFLATLPLLNYYRLHVDTMSARWTSVSIFSSGWLLSESVLTGKSQVTLLLEQFQKSVLAFNLYPDRSFNYAPGIPLLQVVPAIAFVLGIVTSLQKPMKQSNLLLVFWFIAIIIVGGMILDDPPISSRFVLLIPPVLLLVALGLVRTIDLLTSLLQQPSWLSTVVAICLTLGISYGSINFYFVKYTPAYIYGGLNTEVADTMGRYLNTLGPGYRCFFFGPPRMYHSFATIPYLAQNVPIIDAPEEPSADLSWIQGAGTPVFCFLPERLGELDQVKVLCPQGILRQFSDARGEALFYAYEVAPP